MLDDLDAIGIGVVDAQEVVGRALAREHPVVDGVEPVGHRGAELVEVVDASRSASAASPASATPRCRRGNARTPRGRRGCRTDRSSCRAARSSGTRGTGRAPSTRPGPAKSASASNGASEWPIRLWMCTASKWNRSSADTSAASRDLVVHARHLVGRARRAGTRARRGGRRRSSRCRARTPTPPGRAPRSRSRRSSVREQRGDVLLGAAGRVEPAVQDVQHVRSRRVALVERELERGERDAQRIGDRARGCCSAGRTGSAASMIAELRDQPSLWPSPNDTPPRWYTKVESSTRWRRPTRDARRQKSTSSP